MAEKTHTPKDPRTAEPSPGEARATDKGAPTDTGEATDKGAPANGTTPPGEARAADGTGSPAKAAPTDTGEATGGAAPADGTGPPGKGTTDRTGPAAAAAPAVSPAGTAAAAPTGPARRGWLWALPVVTLVVGLLVGFALPRPSGADDSGTQAAPVATATAPGAAPAPGPTVSGRTVFIPASCEEGLTRARAALDTVRQAADALQNLDTARLQKLLDQLQTAQQDVDRLSQQCHQTAAAQNGS